MGVSGWSDAGAHRRRSGRAASGQTIMILAGRPSTKPKRCGAWGEGSAHGVETPAQQIAFSKSMN